MLDTEKKHVDGSAIFYRTSKFALIKEQVIEFNQVMGCQAKQMSPFLYMAGLILIAISLYQVAIANSEGSEDMLNRVMPRDNIALAAMLQTKEACWENGLPPDAGQVSQNLVVTSVHIHWDPDYCDVKLIQSIMLMEQLGQVGERSRTRF